MLAALRARHVYATTDRNLRVVCRVAVGDEMAEGDGRGEALCGDVLAAPAGGGVLGVAAAAAAEEAVDAVAREDSEVYHARSCPQVGVIPVTLLVEGAEAVAGRRPHGVCTGIGERR